LKKQACWNRDSAETQCATKGRSLRVCDSQIAGHRLVLSDELRSAEAFFTSVLPDDHYLWTSGYLNERFPQPVSPLGWSLVGELVEKLAFRDPLRYLGLRRFDFPLTKLYHGHPFVNVRVFQILYKVFPDFLLPEDAYRYFPNGDTSLRKEVPYPRSLFDPRFLLSMLRAFLQDPALWSPWHNDRRWQQFVNRLRGEIQQLEIFGLDESQARRQRNCPSIGELWELVEKARELSRKLLSIHRWSLTHADLTYTLLRRLLQRWLGAERGQELAARLVTGLPNRSVEVNRALYELGEAVREVGLRSKSPRSTRGAPSSSLIPQQPGSGTDSLPHPEVKDIGDVLACLEKGELGDLGEAERRFLACWQRFVEAYGHRSFSLDIYYPPFAEDPRRVLGLMANLSASQFVEETALSYADESVRERSSPWHRDPPDRPAEVSVVYGAEFDGGPDLSGAPRLKPGLRPRFAPGTGIDPEERKAAQERFYRQVCMALGQGPWGWLRWLLFTQVLHLSQRYMILREDQRFHWQEILAVTRRLFLVLGERLQEAGVLRDVSDVFFLTWEEIEKAVRGEDKAEALGKLAQARRAVFQELEREWQAAPQRHYPAFLQGNQPLAEAQPKKTGPGESQSWQGRGVSPGLAEGPVAVVLSPQQLGRVPPGAILVVKGIDPGWTWVFGQIAGLIMEHGGQLSHGAVVAREYGLPAVAGLPGITAHLRDGQWVRVDGTNGSVTMLN